MKKVKHFGEIEHLINEEILIEDGGYVSEYDGQRYANTGYVMDSIVKDFKTAIDEARRIGYSCGYSDAYAQKSFDAEMLKEYGDNSQNK